MGASDPSFPFRRKADGGPPLASVQKDPSSYLVNKHPSAFPVAPWMIRILERHSLLDAHQTTTKKLKAELLLKDSEVPLSYALQHFSPATLPSLYFLCGVGALHLPRLSLPSIIGNLQVID